MLYYLTFFTGNNENRKTAVYKLNICIKKNKYLI